ncbi:uncharacterized protein LOC123697202 [Colias croceus]|uniref:uncharacterized protein LOC123697202 n=1 Tax=Colias crocea TaxID=72248 RepID=UPI001E27ACC7|nr:uncharacterized protein LOC123697202 [Colias croceus]
MNPDPPDPGKPPDIQGEVMEAEHISNKRQRSEASIADTDIIPSKRHVTVTNYAIASSQNSYVDPILSNPITYSDNDSGPFIVYVSRTEADPAAGLTIRPIKFGSFLYNNRVANIAKDGVKAIGRNKISVQFNTASDANNFINFPPLKDSNYQASIPTFHITRMGIVKGVPTEWSMEEFISHVDFPGGRGKILKARRLNKKIRIDGVTSWSPSQTVVLTFQGQIRPDRIYCLYNSMPVEVYQYPTIQCYKCCRFGHVRDQCRSKERCFKCSQAHLGDSCPILESDATCLHCTGYTAPCKKSMSK